MQRCQAYAEAVLLAVILLSQGCGDAKVPVQPTAPLPAPTQQVFSLSGAVSDTAYRPLGSSRVEIVNGPRAGTVATTNESGGFSMPGTFTGTISVIASRDGYVPVTRTVPPYRPYPLPTSEDVGRWEVAFQLEPLGPSANIAGEYSMTLTADSACTNLPAEARTRTYTATIVPAFPGARTGFRATFSDARFFSTHNRASIVTAGDFAGFSISISEANTYSFPGIVEQLRETTYVAIDAGAEGTFGASGLTAPLNGDFEYCPSDTAVTGERYQCLASARVTCSSQRHQLTLVRR